MDGQYFPCVAVVFVSFSWITGYLSCLISRDIWRGIFAASAVVSAGYINSGCFSPSIYWCFVSMLHSVGQSHRFALVEFCWVNSFPCISLFSRS
jgi:hypothetical protein